MAQAKRMCRNFEMVTEEVTRGVISQNLTSDMLMMQPTQNWYRCDRTELLPSPKIG
jgi:hypothetical protein